MENLVCDIPDVTETERNLSNFPVPLLIEDILLIPMKDLFFDELSIFGKSFKTVMCHGRVIAKIGASKGLQDTIRYTVDDGTANIDVYYSHNNRNNRGK